MRRAAAVTAAIVLPLTLTPAPANADLFAHDQIDHPDDKGFDGPIKARCGDRKIFIYEYHSSAAKCDDVDDVYVGAGQEIICIRRNAMGDEFRYVWLDKHGWHNGVMSSGLVSKDCVIGLD